MTLDRPWRRQAWRSSCARWPQTCRASGSRRAVRTPLQNQGRRVANSGSGAAQSGRLQGHGAAPPEGTRCASVVDRSYHAHPVRNRNNLESGPEPAAEPGCRDEGRGRGRLGHRDLQLRDLAGPNGAAGKPATSRAPRPDVDIGALVGRVGNGEPFFIGANAPSLPVEQSGRLYLGPNDDALTDNRGQFRVVVSVVR